MITRIMIARYAPTPSSPAQGRAAPRLRSSDGLKHQKEKRSMDHFAGLDVSVKETCICNVDDTGTIVWEGKVARRFHFSDPW